MNRKAILVLASLSVFAAQAAIVRCDVDGYAQSGLVANFDALRNAGAAAPHTRSSANWVDVVAGRTATLTRVNNDTAAEYLPGAWTEDAYRFAGHSFFMMDEPLALGKTFTAQLVCDVEQTVNYSYTPSSFGVFGDTGNKLRFYRVSGSPQFYVDIHDESNNRGAFRLWQTWSGKSATFARDGSQIGMTFSASETPVLTTEGSQLADDSPTPAQRWIIGAQHANPAGALIGRVHAVRIYTRLLTAQEAAANAALDDIRFRGLVPTRNAVVVASGLPGAEGTEESGTYLVTGSHTFTAPATVTVGGNVYAVDGYSIEPLIAGDDANRRWGAAVEHEGASFEFSEAAEGMNSVRLTWQWKLVEGVEKYDVAAYPQRGLLAFYDGIRNVGATNAHDGTATVWKDVSGNGMDTAQVIADENRPCGTWAPNAYRFCHNDFFRTLPYMTLGPQYTWQIVTETTLGGITSSNWDGNNAIVASDSETAGKSQTEHEFYIKLNQVFVRYATKFRLVSGWANGGRYANAVRDGSRITWTPDVAVSGAAWNEMQGVSALSRTVEYRWDIGGGSVDRVAFDGCLNAVRIYDRMLTDREFAKAREIDEVRFRGFIPPKNTVFVSSEIPGAEGDQECGIYKVLGAGHVFTAQTNRTIGNKIYAPSGCTVETYDEVSNTWIDSENVASWTSPAGEWPSRRIVWRWTVVEGLRKYDVDSYVQEGLVAHFDAIRNVGAGLAHDSSASEWANLANPALPARLVALDAEASAGEWKANAYSLTGSHFWRTVYPFDVGPRYTVQVVADIDTSDQPQNYGLVGTDGNFCKLRSQNATQFGFEYNDGKNNKVFIVWSWPGKYMTAVRNGKLVGQTFGTSYAYDELNSNFNTTNTPAYYGWKCWMIGNSHADANHALVGDVNAVRIYNRPLTNAELEHNRRVDEIRFRGVASDAVNVVVAPGQYEAMTEKPGDYEVEGSWTFTADDAVDPATGKRVKIRGYRIETWTGSGWSIPVFTAGASYRHDTTVASGKIRLTWDWSKPGLMMIVR